MYWIIFQIGCHQTLEKSLSVLSTVFYPQLIRRTTWWAATGRVMLNTTSWPLWKKLPQDWWHAANIASNLSSLTTTSTICCPGNGSSTSKKTGQTKNRPLCLGPRGSKIPQPPPTPNHHHHHSVSAISAFIVFTFHALLPVLRLYPSSLTAAVASAVVADLPSPTPCLSALGVFTLPLGACERAALPPRAARGHLPPQTQSWMCQIFCCLKRLTPPSNNPDGVFLSLKYM